VVFSSRYRFFKNVFFDADRKSDRFGKLLQLTDRARLVAAPTQGQGQKETGKNDFTSGELTMNPMATTLAGLGCSDKPSINPEFYGPGIRVGRFNQVSYRVCHA